MSSPTQASGRALERRTQGPDQSRPGAAMRGEPVFMQARALGDDALHALPQTVIAWVMKMLTRRSRRRM